jgi:hypothetical protein
MGSAQAVDDASAMMAKAAEASITRWKIWGIFFRRLLVLDLLTTNRKGLMETAFHLGHKRHKSTKWVSENHFCALVPFVARGRSL